jgi:hypothetical protein
MFGFSLFKLIAIGVMILAILATLYDHYEIIGEAEVRQPVNEATSIPRRSL